MASNASSKQDLYEIIRSLTEQLERSDKTLVEREAQYRNQVKALEQELRVCREQRDALLEDKNNLISQIAKERGLRQEAQGQLSLSYQAVENAQKEVNQLQGSLSSAAKQHSASLGQARQETESWKTQARTHLEDINERLQTQSEQLDHLMDTLQNHMESEAQLLSRPALTMPPNGSLFGPLITIPLSHRIKHEEMDDNTEPSTQDAGTDESAASRSEEDEQSSAVSAWTESFTPRKKVPNPARRPSSSRANSSSASRKKRKVGEPSGRPSQQAPAESWEDDEDDEMALGYSERKSLSDAASPSGGAATRPPPIKLNTTRTPTRINSSSGGNRASHVSSAKRRK